MTFSLIYDDGESFIKRHLEELDREAQECGAELGIPNEMRYDALSVLHGEAFLGERDASCFEASPVPSFQSENDEEIAKMKLVDAVRLSEKGENTRDLNSEETVARALQGYVEALEQLYENHINVVYEYMLHLAGNEENAEALTSETFTRAIAALLRGQYVSMSYSFSAWLRRIASNVYLEWRREHNRESALIPLDRLSNEEEEGIVEAILEQERQNSLRQMVRGLPPTEQKILVLRYKYDLSYVEIAKQLSITESACKMRHYRALHSLKIRLREPNLSANARRNEGKPSKNDFYNILQKARVMVHES